MSRQSKKAKFAFIMKLRRLRRRIKKQFGKQPGFVGVAERFTITDSTGKRVYLGAGAVIMGRVGK